MLIELSVVQILAVAGGDASHALEVLPAELELSRVWDNSDSRLGDVIDQRKKTIIE